MPKPDPLVPAQEFPHLHPDVIVLCLKAAVYDALEAEARRLNGTGEGHTLVANWFVTGSKCAKRCRDRPE